MDLDAIAATAAVAILAPAVTFGAVAYGRRARTRAHVKAYLDAHGLAEATPLWRQTYSEMHDPTTRYMPVYKDGERHVLVLKQVETPLDGLPLARVYFPVRLREHKRSTYNTGR